MSIGKPADLIAMVLEDGSCTHAAAGYDFYQAGDIADWEKKTALVGTGQCVALVQAASGAPLTSFWRKGPKIKPGSKKIPSGTAIATFNSKDLYANQATGNHAAIFVSVDANGIVVVDQWASLKAPARRTLKFRGGKGSASNDGDQFSVIVTQKIQNHPDKK